MISPSSDTSARPAGSRAALRLSGATALVLLCCAAPLAAQEGPSRYTVGLGLRYAPEYQGSGDMQARVLPFVSLNYGIVTLGPERISLNWRPGSSNAQGYEGLTISGYLGYGGGRDAADMGLAGFSDIDASVRVGLRASYVIGVVDLYGQAERYLGGSEGATMTLGAGTRFKVDDRLTLRFALSATFADDTYMDAYFGVTPEQAALNNVSVFDTSAGYQRFNATMSARYKLDRNWSLLGQLGYGGLAGSLSDSAVVEQGTAITSTVGVLYSF